MKAIFLIILCQELEETIPNAVARKHDWGHCHSSLMLKSVTLQTKISDCRHNHCPGPAYCTKVHKITHVLK